jgi:hypothetical protein
VYNQWLLKGNEGARNMELWEKNIFMYIWGLTFGLGERSIAWPCAVRPCCPYVVCALSSTTS